MHHQELSFRQISEYIASAATEKEFVDRLVELGLLQISWDHEKNEGVALLDWPSGVAKGTQTTVLINESFIWEDARFTGTLRTEAPFLGIDAVTETVAGILTERAYLTAIRPKS